MTPRLLINYTLNGVTRYLGKVFLKADQSHNDAIKELMDNKDMKNRRHSITGGPDMTGCVEITIY
jgi:hypothetical protein